MVMYNYRVGYSTDVGIWLIISAILAIIGGIALYFTFLKKSNEEKFKGFTGWLYDFLSFKKMLIESLLKILYLICAIFVTLYSFIAGGNILGCLILLVLGNLFVRIAYEFSLILLVICRNTTDINKKLGNNCCKEEKPIVEINHETEVKTETKVEPEIKTEVTETSIENN